MTYIRPGTLLFVGYGVWQTYCYMLPLIAEVMNPEFWFAKRRIHFLSMAHNSSSQKISNMGRFGTSPIMGGNIGLLIEQIWHECKTCSEAWNDRISKNEELVIICEQVKKVVGMRDRCISSVMSQSECGDSLTFLYTG